METKFNFDGLSLFTPIAFREDFNQFAKLSATQAWSLFFTASRDDSALGLSRAAGRFWTGLLVATAIESILGVIIFQVF